MKIDLKGFKVKDREVRRYSRLMVNIRDFLRLSNLKNNEVMMMEKMKSYGQDEYFMDKMKYKTKVFKIPNKNFQTFREPCETRPKSRLVTVLK